MSKYLSNTVKDLTIGIRDYTELETVLTVIGNTNITGNLVVGGGSFQLETETVVLRDPLIELGLIKDEGTGQFVPPTADLGNDLGIVLNYFDTVSNAAQKAVLYFDNDTDRFKLASRAVINESLNSVSALAYAALEASALYITDAAGSGPVIEYNTDVNERLLTSVSIDCGFYGLT